MAEHVVDPAHVYVVGVSNGGLMAQTLACQRADRIAGAAPIITGMIERQAEQCRPKRLVPLMVVAGTDDWIQAYDGATEADFRLLSIPKTLEFWRRLRQCASMTLTEIPRHAPMDPTATIATKASMCRPTHCICKMPSSITSDRSWTAGIGFENCLDTIC